MKLTAQQTSNIQDHAIVSYPSECCGIIKNGDYIECKNVAEDPESSFKIADKVMARLLPVEAIVHSHPDGPDCPSAADMRSQAAAGVPFVIVCSDGAAATEPFILDPMAPPMHLEDRPFRHGITDCYGLIRDWYRLERDIVLADYPRDWEWWDKDGPGDGADDLYVDHYAAWGFCPLLSDEAPARGDVFLIKTPRAKAINHGGIYLGDGLGLHHLTSKHAFDVNRMSETVPLHRWQSMIALWLRYEGKKP